MRLNTDYDDRVTRSDRDGGGARRSVLRVLIVAVPPVRALDLFGPAEVFRDANRLHGGDREYDAHMISAASDRVISSHIGTPVHTNRTYREYRGPIDTLLVAGGVGARDTRYEPGFLDWLRNQSTKSRRFGSICTGAFVLAEAGLLDGRRATTHWNWADELAGVTAGIDLCLALDQERFYEFDSGSRLHGGDATQRSGSHAHIIPRPEKRQRRPPRIRRSAGYNSLGGLGSSSLLRCDPNQMHVRHDEIFRFHNEQNLNGGSENGIHACR